MTHDELLSTIARAAREGWTELNLSHNALHGHEGCRALIKADREDKKIFISITGDVRRRREFLAIIRSQFDAIHASIAKLEAKGKVALPMRPDIVVDDEHLLNLEQLGIEDFVPEGMREKVSVRDLLNGVESAESRTARRGYREEHYDIKIGDIGERAVVSIGRGNDATANINQPPST